MEDLTMILVVTEIHIVLLRSINFKFKYCLSVLMISLAIQIS